MPASFFAEHPELTGALDPQQQPQLQQQASVSTAGSSSSSLVGQLVTPKEMEFLSDLRAHEKGVNIVRFSPDGAWLASAGDGKFIKASRKDPVLHQCQWLAIWRRCLVFGG